MENEVKNVGIEMSELQVDAASSPDSQSLSQDEKPLLSEDQSTSDQANQLTGDDDGLPDW